MPARPILDLSTAKILVELTNRCNLRCGMCPMNDLQRPDADMPWWLVEKVAGELREAGVTASWLYEMGDPLLYPRLPEAIELFPGASISTNAGPLDRAYGRELLATSLRRIRLCIDTLDPEIYPVIRRGGSFDQVVGNIKAFLEESKGHDISVEIQKMITLQTAHETIPDFQAFFELEKYPQAKVIEKTCEGLDTSAATDLHEAFYGCFQGYPFNWVVVMADGRVSHCCYDAHCEQPIGDLKMQSLREIVENPVLEEMMRAFKAKDWERLPRCGECYRETTGKALVVDKLTRVGHSLDRVLPVKQIARKIINR